MKQPIAHVDFETFSHVDLRGGPKGVGTSRAAEDPSTEILCLGWAIGDDEPRVWIPRPAYAALAVEGELRPEFHRTPPEELFRHAEDGDLVHAWNVEMEIPHWTEIAHGRLGWPEIPLDCWRDTGAVALTYALPASLEGTGEALGLDVQKDQRGKHLLNKLAKPRRVSKHNPATRWEVLAVPEDYRDLYLYCAQDVRAERAVHHALPVADLPPLELEIWRATVDMNLHGWNVDLDSAKRVIDLLEIVKGRRLAELEKITDGAVTTANQLERILDWLADRSVHLPNMKAPTIEDVLLRDSSIPPDARRLLEIRLELAKSSVSKYKAMIRRACRDGRVRNNIVYSKATTGRDAGSGLQIQNFVRKAIAKNERGVDAAIRAVEISHERQDPGILETIYGNLPDTFSKLCRSHLTASPGYVLYSADFSSIENRVAVWVSDCKFGIDIFVQGLDEYKTFSAARHGIAYEDVTDEQRAMGKVGVLACTFGGGRAALLHMGAVFGFELTQKEADAAVRGYRKTYPEVVAMWYGMTKAAHHTVRTGRPTSYGKVGWRMNGRFLQMKLPSGRFLSYPDPKVEKKTAPWGEKIDTLTYMGTNPRTKKWERLKAIPGKLFENLVQATARDAMMAGALATIRGGYQLVGRVHDELVSQVLLGTGDLADYERLMCPHLPWLQGIPITAEGWTGFRYRK